MSSSEYVAGGRGGGANPNDITGVIRPVPTLDCVSATEVV